MDILEWHLKNGNQLRNTNIVLYKVQNIDQETNSCVRDKEIKSLFVILIDCCLTPSRTFQKLQFYMYLK